MPLFEQFFKQADKSYWLFDRIFIICWKLKDEDELLLFKLKSSKTKVEVEVSILLVKTND